MRKSRIRASIRVIPDFPKPGARPTRFAAQPPARSFALTLLATAFYRAGIMFQDITTLLLNPVAYKDCCSLLEERYRGFGLDAIAGFEARGFFFGPPLALALGLPFVPLRKPKKLPGAPFSRRKRTPQPPPNPCLASGPTISESYALEYGTDALEMHVGAVTAGQRVLLVDDLVATGGTLCAGAALIRRAGAIPVEACCIIELPELGVRRLRRRRKRAWSDAVPPCVVFSTGAQAAGRPAVLHAD